MSYGFWGVGLKFRVFEDVSGCRGSGLLFPGVLRPRFGALGCLNPKHLSLIVPPKQIESDFGYIIKRYPYTP